jgi:hypothetical protein
VNGVYDNTGYTLRGHVFSNENGYYEIESIEPEVNPGDRRQILFSFIVRY